MWIRSLVSAATVGLLLAVSHAAASGPHGEGRWPLTPQGVNQDAEIQHEFTKRVERYLALRREAERVLPDLPRDAEPEQIAAHHQALLRELVRRRADAKPGDLFQPDTQALIRRLLREARQRPAGAQATSAIREEDPGPIRVNVNGTYPDELPVTTVPPQVLLALPRLPEPDLEYRFVGHRLLLLDSRARMIVDYMDRALP